ncbi:methionine ABC transporter permease [Streptococcus caprae]|uniref:Methionine ABC transporter permease n=1 Tax=Streptococcus caprae TaxID=1640501 RepID=A0ABV8CVP4_9STRE
MQSIYHFIEVYLPNVYKMGWDGQAGWWTAIYATLYMTFWSFVIGGLLGLITGLLLVLTQPRGILENKVVFWIVDKIASLYRAIPFIILLALLSGFTRFIVGTSIGPTAAIVPLAISVWPFYARQVQIALSELDRGVIEAAQASGATFWDIVQVYFREGLPELIRVTTMTLVSLIGYTAMAGAIGSGGLGNVAISYGYNRYNDDVTIVATVLILILVFAVQFIGDTLTKKINHR